MPPVDPQAQAPTSSLTTADLDKLSIPQLLDTITTLRTDASRIHMQLKRADRNPSGIPLDKTWYYRAEFVRSCKLSTVQLIEQHLSFRRNQAEVALAFYQAAQELSKNNKDISVMCNEIQIRAADILQESAPAGT